MISLIFQSYKETESLEVCRKLLDQLAPSPHVLLGYPGSMHKQGERVTSFALSSYLVPKLYGRSD